ncbi:MAG: spoVD2, partial [Bacillota bacterium]|jgi:peptidoglycan glycosyltransferase/penicillin-binding protein 2|nr:spoVD2 [Bacillota bacterium]
MVVHGWFTGFFPVENPQYVITVFIESGGSGRASAVPLFRQMAEYLY